jgi:hypothetical protein
LGMAQMIGRLSERQVEYFELLIDTQVLS